MKDIFLELISNTTFLTVISGVLVFVLSQLFLELIIVPNKTYKSLKERIGYTLAMYACYYTNPYRFDREDNARDKEEYTNASIEMRKIGSELSGYIGILPWYKCYKKKRLKKVRDCLIGISNGFYQYPNYNPIQDNKGCEKEIKEILKIK